MLLYSVQIIIYYFLLQSLWNSCCCSLGFISYVVRPLFVEWQRLVCSPLSNQLLENLTINLKRWNAVGADEAATVAAAGDSSNDSTPTPSTGEPNQYFTTPDNDDASKTTLGSTQPTDDGGTDGGVNCDSDNNSRRRSKAHAWLSDCQRDSSCQTVRCSSKDGDTFRRGSLPPPVVSVTDTKTHRRNSMPAVDGSQSSSMRRCILLTSLAENPPSVHVLSPDTPSPQPSVSPAHSGELNDIAQLNVDDCDKTCLLLTQCNGRRGSAPAACVVPNNIVPTTASCWKPASLWRDNRSKSHSATRSASLLLIETSSSSAARRSSNVVFPLDRRLVYMVAEGMGTPAVATVTSSQIVKGWSRSRRSNSAHAIIFRPRFVAGRRCSSPAIGNKNRTPWPTDDATDHMATDSGKHVKFMCHFIELAITVKFCSAQFLVCSCILLCHCEI
jgi:hypothetical protein